MWGGGVRLAFVRSRSGDFLAYTENTLSQREHTPPPLLRQLFKIHQTDPPRTQQAMPTGAAAVSCALCVSHDRKRTVGLAFVVGTATRTAAQEGQGVMLCGGSSGKLRVSRNVSQRKRPCVPCTSSQQRWERLERFGLVDCVTNIPRITRNVKKNFSAFVSA